MKKTNKTQLYGFLFGLVIALLIYICPITGLSIDGKISLSLSILAVCWWAFKVMNPGYVALTLLIGYTLFLDKNIVPNIVVFGTWTSPIMYLVVGGFLIAEAVSSSGLGNRIALLYAKKFINGYSSIIISCYILGGILSFIIPHPWPRSFLILSVMNNIIDIGKIEKEYATNIRLAVFVSSIPTSMILLTGDSSLNPLIAEFSKINVSWFEWVLYMALPGILLAIVMCLINLKFFKNPVEFSMDKSLLEEKIKSLGKISLKEIYCIVVLGISVTCWMLDSVLGIHPAWVAIIAVIILASPFIRVLTDKSFQTVSFSTLLFLCAALAIGQVGNLTGMNAWIADVILPSTVSSNPYIFALTTCIICMVIHMFLGSTLAVLGIVIPAIISFGTLVGVSPLISSLLAYIAVSSHWILPFHHMNLLVGCGENSGGLDEQVIVKLGVVQTGITLAFCIIAISWWQIIGLV